MKAVSADRIFDGDNFHENCSLLLKDGKVEAIIATDELTTDLPVIDCGKTLLAPGYIDLQVNGGGGVLLNNAPTQDSLKKVATGHASKGTTRYMATLVSDTPSITKALLSAVSSSHQDINSGAIGIHQEGPFFNPIKRGAHLEAYIRKPDHADNHWLRELATLPNILTLAPEMVGTEFIEHWAQAGVNISLGHSHATALQANDAQLSGAKLCTHLYNAMSGLKARDSGLIGASLENDALACSIILDGHHVDKTAAELAFKCKPRGKLFFVSDAMATTGSTSTSFELYGEKLVEIDNKLINENGLLAGASIGLSDAVIYAKNHFQWPLDEILRMASLYPAMQLDLADKYGKLTAGHIADIVVLDNDLQPTSTFRAGQEVYRRA